MANLHPWWATYIRTQAAKRGLDPAAVLAVASREGLSGGVGDGGHAFGPFQLNDAGGVLTNRPGNHRAFSESKQGIDFALDSMVPSAKGLRGQSAIDAIVRKFERPANPDAEVAGATGAYGQFGSTAPAAPAGQTKLSGGLGAQVLDQGVQTAQDGAAAIRAQARQNLGDIASGATSATESLAKIPDLVKTLHASIPKVDNPYPTAQAAGGDGTLESQAVALARKFIGIKYTWGGTNAAQGFDCSGLVQSVWKSLGVSVPRTTYDQWGAGKAVNLNSLKPGDALFFTGSDPMDGKPGHEGMYIGDGKFIEAPGSGQHVKISTLADRGDFVGARRFG
jgi:cell wall-associated NlpC family hydrolase